MIDIAYNTSDRLVRLINDFLDMERIESGRMEYSMGTVDVMAVVERALHKIEPYAADPDLAFVVTDAVSELDVVGDEDRLMQMMANLLSNAAKFSPPHGRIEVSVTSDAAEVLVAVTDHGPGVPESFTDEIFQKFTQADSSDTRSQDGTGLGLSISKAIVERHGGSIGFDSEPGRGSTFFFKLPRSEQTLSADRLDPA